MYEAICFFGIITLQFLTLNSPFLSIALIVVSQYRVHYVDAYVSVNLNVIDNFNVPRDIYIDFFVIVIKKEKMGFDLISRVKGENTNVRLEPRYLLYLDDVH